MGWSKNKAALEASKLSARAENYRQEAKQAAKRGDRQLADAYQRDADTAIAEAARIDREYGV